MADLIIYRNSAVLYTVKIDESTVYSGQVVGENEIKASFESPVKLTLLIGDYIQHNGQIFKLNKPVEELKSSSFDYRYTGIFEGPEYSLYNKIIEHLGTADFTYFGTPDTFLDLIVSNINTIDIGWQKGSVETIEGGKFISFQNESCRQALTKVAEEFELEYSFDGKEISIVKTVGQLIPDLVFEYGKGNGLYSLNRKPVNDESFGTRFIGYGSTQNIPSNYRDGKRRLSFNPGYIDRNVGIYGIIERPVVFDYIFPRRTGTATSFQSNIELIDSNIDFNLNDVIVQGKAKIVFKSGDLQGNEFEIASYNHTTKKITFNPNVEENGYTLPNDTVKAAAGDTYTLIGIEMPQSYIDAAELELKNATEQYAESFKNPFYAFDLSIDEKFIRDNGLVGVLERGDRVKAVDAAMGVDTTLRIQAISYPLCNPGKITATISDKVNYTLAETILKTVSKQIQQIQIVYKTVDEVNRDLAIKQREFQNKVFDPDGYFDGGKIKPETVEAISIASGARSQQFTLSVIFQPNFGADANSILWSAGNLVHNTIDDAGIKTWNIASGNRTDLVTLEPYYIYAKCLKDGNTGTIVIDTVARRVNDDPDYYYFLIGQLSSVIGGVRWPQLTYGTSTINGRFMTTGRVQSANLQSYIDLDTNQFNFGNSISGIDYNVTTPNQLTVRGHIDATSGTIAGVAISAGNSFQLIGTKVKIKPDRGMMVYDGGYLMIPKAPFIGLQTDELDKWQLYVDEEGIGGTAIAPPIVSHLYDLLDVDIAGVLDGEILRYSMSAGKWVRSTASMSAAWNDITNKPTTIAGYGITDAYTKTQSDSIYPSISGYNKSNWDSAYGWGNHAGAGYALSSAVTSSLAGKANVNGSNATGSWNIDISGIAAYAIQSESSDWAEGADYATYWGNQLWVDANKPTFGSFMTNSSGSWGYSSISQVQAALGLGGRWNWANLGSSDIVTGMLSWNNYGNGHVIFDASKGIAPDGTAINNTNSANPWFSSCPTLMGWNGNATFGLRVDSARLADSATNWGSRPAQFGTLVDNVSSVAALDSEGKIREASTSQLQNYLGLGSAAYLTGANVLKRISPAERLLDLNDYAYSGRNELIPINQDNHPVANNPFSYGTVANYQVADNSIQMGFEHTGEIKVRNKWYTAAWSPWKKLLYEGDVTLQSVTDRGAVTSNGKEVKFKWNNGLGDTYIGGNTSYSRIGSSSGPLVINEGGGNVGIKKYDPLAALDVAGTMRNIHNTPGWNNFESQNTSETGYGFYSKGGGGNHPNYIFRIDNYAGVKYMEINGSGSIVMHSAAYSLGGHTVDGILTATTIQATTKLLIPSTSGASWELYVEDN